MKKSLLALLLVACTSPSYDAAPDAGVTIDAAVPQNRGCPLGNLPLARSINFANGDPIPSALLNEMQDQIVGNKFAPELVGIGGSGFQLIAGTGTQADDGWTSLNSSTRLVANLCIPTGIRILQISWSQVGSGSGNATMKLRTRELVHSSSAVTVSTDTISSGSGFINHGMSSGLPYDIPAFITGNVTSVWLEFNTTDTGATFLGALVGFQRT
jgi:hypothetical protein